MPFFLLLCVAALAACSPHDSPAPTTRLRVGGSASVRDVASALLEEFAVEHPDVAIHHLPSTHSGSAIRALREGELDLAYLSREPTREERTGLSTHPFARDPLVFAVNRKSGVRGVTTQQLRDLYGGRIRSWSQLGGAAVPVILLDRPEHSSPKLLLRSGLFGNLEVEGSAAVSEMPEPLEEGLLTYPGAIGYLSLRSALALGERVDVLRLDGIYPDAESVHTGEYPLARTLLFVAPEAAGPDAGRFLASLATSAARYQIESHALVPLRREIRLAVPPMRNIVSLEVKYGALARHLQERLGRPVELSHQASYTDLVEAFRQNRVDAAFLGSFTYLLANLEAGAEVLARPDYGGISVYRGCLYVRADSPFQGLADLRGAVVAHAGRATTAGYIFPLHALHEGGLPPPATYFAEFYDAGSHESALRAVLEGKADAAAAKDLVFEELVREDTTLRSRLREVECSPPVPSNGLAAGPLLDPDLRSQIRDLLLTLDRSPRGRQALRDMGAQRFLVTSDEDYRNLYEMVAAVSSQLGDFFHYR